MDQGPWISLNMLENALINYSDYARVLNMFVIFTCVTGF